MKGAEHLANLKKSSVVLLEGGRSHVRLLWDNQVTIRSYPTPTFVCTIAFKLKL